MRRGYGYSDRGYRQQRLIGLLFALFQQIMQLEYKPPTTVALVLGMVLLHLGQIGSEIGLVIPPVTQACIQPHHILKYGQWGRLLWGPFLHGDETHLFYNMSSLIWKGAQLEYGMGSLGFLVLVAEFLLLSNVIYILSAVVLMTTMPTLYYRTCAVGFSAVLFGMKVVLNWDSPGTSPIMGIQIPAKYLCWAELFYIQLLTPNASFVGHLAGIVAGILHVKFLRNTSIFQRLRPHRPPPRPEQHQSWWDGIFGQFANTGFGYRPGGYGGYPHPGGGYNGGGAYGRPYSTREGGYYRSQVFDDWHRR